MELPAGHSIMVSKGDTFFLLGFHQFVPGREKTDALARIVAGHFITVFGAAPKSI